LFAVPLTSKFENQFWNHVNSDLRDYYFFIWDWKLQKGKTKIFLVLDEREEIVGLMLIYDNRFVQLSGEKEAAQLLLSQLDLKKVDLQAPLEWSQSVLEKYPTFAYTETILLLSLSKGEENLQVSTLPEKLTINDAHEIAGLLRLVCPKFWNVITVEDIQAMFSGRHWYGIKNKGKLVSLGTATATPKVSHVNWIATQEQYRNRGYAKSILSAMLKEIMKTSSTVIIYVLNNNVPARRVYSTVGFKQYKRYIYVRNQD
jgi:predicted GNAT family acetyltransferase